jgi:phospholipase C
MPARVLAWAAMLAIVTSCTHRPNSEQVFRNRVHAHIRHVIIVIQENRSFDNLFHGFRGADTADTGFAHDGTRVPLQAVSLTAAYDIGNGLEAFKRSYDNGKMDAFDEREVVPRRGAHVPLAAAQYPAYAYVPRPEIRPYWDLAERFVVADRMFQSNIDQSFAAHLYLIAGQSQRAVNTPNGFPWGCDAPGSVSVPTLTTAREIGGRVFPCFQFRTLADELADKGLRWRYYAPAITVRVAAKGAARDSYYLSALPTVVRDAKGIQDAEDRAPKGRAPAKRPDKRPRRSPAFNVGQLWSAFDAVATIRYSSAWNSSVISPPSQFLRDVERGDVAAVTWVVPDWANSDHPFSRSATGPSWVSAIVNAVGRSPIWDDTVILITWDDSGGWFDHVPPPTVDFAGLGVRVPLLVVSAYARRGLVDHRQYEFGSMLRLAEAAFSLAPLAASDTRANDLIDCFDFSKPPRPFERIEAPVSSSYFLHQPPSLVPPDDD